MQRLSSTNNILIFSPGAVGVNAADKISVMLYGTSGSLAGLVVYALSPSGQLLNITEYFRETVIGLSFLTLFEAPFTFAASGRYKFMVHDTVSGDTIIDATDVAAWTSNIDMPISEVANQRVDIQRIFSRIGA